ncbi:MAG: class I SAM-dependent methyltransferase [Candidatus Binatia bacterium]
MSLADCVHGAYILDRRARILSRHLADTIPPSFRVLDVGCGDGLLAHSISQNRPDLTLRGIDVLVRDCIHIPVDHFDGHVIPYDDASFDGVMFVDVLHHTTDPMVLLREAVRVARKTIVIKDHTLEGLFAGFTLRFMDTVGNARHGVPLPYNYWPRRRWFEAFDALGLQVGIWNSKLGIYPWPARWIFERSLHFVARLDVVTNPSMLKSFTSIK